MPAPIPEAIKSKVIELWLLGYSRDSMASANTISAGAVSNIVKEWEDKLGRDVMRGLRATDFENRIKYWNSNYSIND